MALNCEIRKKGLLGLSSHSSVHEVTSTYYDN